MVIFIIYNICDSVSLFRRLTLLIMVEYLFLLMLVGNTLGNSFSNGKIQDLFEMEHQLIHNFRNYAKELQDKLRIIKG